MAKILFVDDDYLTLEMYEKIFSIYGHQIELAESGKQALNYLNEKSFDLIVLDMRLQDVEGFDLIEQINTQQILGEIPIVVVSANPDLYAKKAIEAGALHYMSKPINLDKLMDILKQQK